MKNFLVIIGYILNIIVFVIQVYYAYLFFGLFGIIVGLVLFPVLLIAMPFYVAFAIGNWIPLILMVSAFALIGVGSYFAAGEEN